MRHMALTIDITGLAPQRLTIAPSPLAELTAMLHVRAPQTRVGASFGDPAAVAKAIEKFNQIAREEIEATGGTFIDIFPLMREQMRRGMTAPDGLHPSAEAYAEWADALKDALR